MFGRPRITGAGPGAASAAIIASGKRWLCTDWNCPAHVSCSKHWGRSKYYAAMAEKHPLLVFPDRERSADSCEHYSYDEPRAWLIGGRHISPVQSTTLGGAA